jgi:DNA-binding response OmpR family regulator
MSGSRPLSGVAVLLVDDEDAVRRALAMYLRRQGAGVVEAKSYAEAADQLLARKFHIVVSDVMLGDGSGLTLGRLCRTFKPPVAFLAITGAIEDDILDDDVTPTTVFLQKPFALDELRARVLDALGRTAAQEH